MDGIPDGPFFSVEPGAEPYPELMNRGAIEEISAIEPDAVLVKGDLTCDGLDEEYAAFLAAYGPAFGDRLHHVRGNHDAYRHQTYAPEGPQRIDVEGLTLGAARHHHPGSQHRADARRAARVAGRPRRRGRPTRAGPRAPPRLEPRREHPARRLLRHPPGRLGAVHRGRRAASEDHRLRRRAHAPQPGAALRRHRRSALDRGRLRQGLPGQLGRVPGVRGRGAAGPPPHLHARGVGVDGEDARHVRRRLRRVRVRCARAIDASPCGSRVDPAGAPRRHPRPRPGHRHRRARRRAVPGRLRRRRAQGRAPGHGGQHPRHGRARPRRRHVAVLEARGAQQALRDRRPQVGRRARRRSCAWSTTPTS